MLYQPNSKFSLQKFSLHWKKKFIESNELAVASGQPHMLSIEHYIYLNEYCVFVLELWNNYFNYV